MIEGAGELPEFSPMSGDGVVTVQHTELEPVDFVLSMEWTGWDELGRTTEGVMHFVSEETGYEIVLDIREDGTKEGVVLLDGALVGRAELIVTEEGSYIEFEEIGG